MDLIEAIKLCAFHEVTAKEHSREYFLRHVMRWYSRTFATPLHVVEGLPLDGILVAYYEDRYENMEPDDLERTKALLAETAEERKKRLEEERQAEIDEEQRIHEIEREERERYERIEAKKRQKLVENGDAPKPGAIVIDTMGGNRTQLVPESEMRSAPGVVVEADEPLIRMTFADEEALEKELDSLGGMAPPPPKKG